MELKEQPDGNILAFEPHKQKQESKPQIDIERWRRIAWATPKQQTTELPGFINCEPQPNN